VSILLDLRFHFWAAFLAEKFSNYSSAWRGQLAPQLIQPHERGCKTYSVFKSDNLYASLVIQPAFELSSRDCLGLRAEDPRCYTVPALEPTYEPTHILSSGEECYLFDTEEGTFQKSFGALNAQFSKKLRGRLSDFVLKQLSEARGGQVHTVGYFNN
jgi:hypothetical protein